MKQRYVNCREWYDKKKIFVPIWHVSIYAYEKRKKYGKDVTVELELNVKDKYDRHIYCGDIVKVYDALNENIFIGVVDCKTIENPFIENCNKHYYNWGDYVLEVIGNIHQNNYLLLDIDKESMNDVNNSSYKFNTTLSQDFSPSDRELYHVEDMFGRTIDIGDKISILLLYKHFSQKFKATIEYWYGDMLVEFEDKNNTVLFPKNLSRYIYPVNKVIKLDDCESNRKRKKEVIKYE